MSKLQSIPSKSLSETMASPGISRHLAFQGEGCQVVRSRGDPGVVSGWHHHGEYNVYGYVVHGQIRIESDQQEDTISLGPGDFFNVPPHTIHREVNPIQDQGNEVILFLRGAGPLVYNVEGSPRA